MNRISILFLLLPVLSHAEVFKCRAESGRITYSETPCVAGALSYKADQISIGESAQSASLKRGDDGVFKATGSVNDQPVDFVIDTGASMTTLSGDVASRLGLRNCIAAGYAHTANGETEVCRIMLPKLTVAGLSFSNVPVLVSPNMRGVALLGNDLLKQLNVKLHGDMLTLSR